MWENDCDSISTTTTFTTEACQENFKTQKGPLNCDSEKVLYLLKCKVCGEVPYVGKQKPNFARGLTITKVNTEHSEKVTKKFFRNVFTLTIASIATVEVMIRILCFLNNVKHMSSLKKGKPFWQRRLKTFYPIRLNEKEEYLY